MHYFNDFREAKNTYEGLFYVRRVVDLMKMAKVNAYIMHIFVYLELNNTITKDERCCSYECTSSVKFNNTISIDERCCI